MTKIYFWIAARTKGNKDEDSADVVKPESVLAVDAKAAELILMAKVAAKSDVDPNKVVTVVRPFE